LKRATGSAAVAALAAQLKAGNSEYARRRRQLARLVGRDGIAILPSAPVRHRNSDVEHPYRQDSDFHYLTGFDEPEAVAVLVPGRDVAEYILFVRPRSAAQTWDGHGAPDPPSASRRHAADDAFPISDMDEILPGLMENRERVYYAMGHPEFDQRVLGWLATLRGQAPRLGKHPPQEMVALDHVLHDMRLYKSRVEAG
jgi:Xaa-Pro aminopeptidase